MKSSRLRCACAASLLIVSARHTEAALTISSGLGTTHTGNIVTNGSFEVVAPPDGAANSLYWATGTASTPTGTPVGWKAAGAPGNTSRWGNDGGTPYRLASSDVLPDGRAGIFFNNGTGNVDMPPTMLPNGEITFPGTPNFVSTNGAPAVIGQSVPTHLNIQPSYNLSFWVSGEENATNQGNIGLSIMGFRLTNVLPGDPIQYLTVPNGFFLGQSHLYEYTFTPINPLAPVTLSFMTWGHMNLTPWGGTPFGTEAIIDDVIINAVPEPAALGLSIAGAVGLCLMRRRLRHGRSSSNA